MLNKKALAAFVAMPLVNAASHSNDKFTAADDEYKTAVSSTKATCTAETVKVVDEKTGKATVKVNCTLLQGELNKNKKVVLPLEFDLTSVGDDIELDTPTNLAKHELDGKALSDSAYFASKKATVNIELDPAKVGTKDEEDVKTIVLSLYDKTLKDNINITYTVHVDYYQGIYTNNPTDSEVYVLNLETMDGKKVTLYPNAKVGEAKAALKDANLGSYTSLAGYRFVGFATVTGGVVSEETYQANSSKELDDLDVSGVITLKAIGVKTGETTEPSENQGSTTKPADKDKDSTPKTGNTDLMGFVPLMTLLSLVGIVTLKKTI